MAKFRVTTTARATIRETFIVEADNAEKAANAVLGDDSKETGGTVLESKPDEVLGDEEDREVEEGGVEEVLETAGDESCENGMHSWVSDPVPRPGDCLWCGEPYGDPK